jgi:hypothetical protein
VGFLKGVLMTTPLSSSVASFSVASSSVTDNYFLWVGGGKERGDNAYIYGEDVRDRVAEILMESLSGPPFFLQLRKGQILDKPDASAETAHALVNKYLDGHWVLLCLGEPVALPKPEQIVGCTVGCVIDDAIYGDLNLGLEKLGAKKGDYYAAAAAILKEHQGKKVSSEICDGSDEPIILQEVGAYTAMCRHRLRIAETSRSKRVWVRTHANQDAVKAVYIKKLGFGQVGEILKVQQGNVVTERIWMMKEFDLEVPPE